MDEKIKETINKLASGVTEKGRQLYAMYEKRFGKNNFDAIYEAAEKDLEKIEHEKIHAEAKLRETLTKLLDKLKLKDNFDLFWQYLKENKVSDRLQQLLKDDVWARKAMDLLLDAQLMTAEKLGCMNEKVKIEAEMKQESQEEVKPQVVRIKLIPYLKAMANLFWSAIRHPTKTTEIDLSTGNVLRRF